MARQKANMSDLLKENQKYEQLPNQPASAEGEDKNTNTSTPQNDNTLIPQNSNEVLEQSINDPNPQDINTVLPQNDKTGKQENINTSQTKKRTNPSRSKSDNTVKPQKGKIVKQQSANTPIPQSLNPSLSQNERMTDKRDRVTFYLDPGQLEKLEELKIEYRKETGIRINEQEIVRRVIDRLTLDFLL